MSNESLDNIARRSQQRYRFIPNRVGLKKRRKKKNRDKKHHLFNNMINIFFEMGDGRLQKRGKQIKAIIRKQLQ